MKQVKKSVLLWYSPREMYDLVVDVAAYPGFLPWCERAELLADDDTGMTARLHLAYAGLRHAFTTRNEHTANQTVVMTLVDGPFSMLDGHWRFVQIGAAGTMPACRIEFELRYAFANVALETVLSPVFDKIANTFVDSFVHRA
ncbi:type II toxin-antitoxin system RatA family toxin, partial [Aquabacterium sp.]|uniref:type II toxin-antitoxin system RatA family toxin n=1 Tax=Aquabacterium sp. TaxID=1872578 RepID=UPI002BE30490